MGKSCIVDAQQINANFQTFKLIRKRNDNRAHSIEQQFQCTRTYYLNLPNNFIILHSLHKVLDAFHVGRIRMSRPLCGVQQTAALRQNFPKISNTHSNKRRPQTIPFEWHREILKSIRFMKWEFVKLYCVDRICFCNWKHITSLAFTFIGISHVSADFLCPTINGFIGVMDSIGIRMTLFVNRSIFICYSCCTSSSNVLWQIDLAHDKNKMHTNKFNEMLINLGISSHIYWHIYWIFYRQIIIIIFLGKEPRDIERECVEWGTNNCSNLILENNFSAQSINTFGWKLGAYKLLTDSHNFELSILQLGGNKVHGKLRRNKQLMFRFQL